MDIFTLGVKADTTDIKKGEKDLDNFSDAADKTSKSVGKTSKKIEAMRNNVNMAGTAIATFGVTAATALGAATVSAGKAAKEIQVFAHASGLSTKEFQDAAFAASTVGYELKDLSDVYKDFQDRVGDFLTAGAGPMVDFFEQVAPKVGVTAEAFKNLSGKDSLELYVSSLEKAQLSQSEMVFYMEAMSGESTNLLPLLTNNAEGFNKLTKRSDELGLSLKDFEVENLHSMNVALEEMGAISAATSNVIGAAFAPFLTDLVEQFNATALSGTEVREMFFEVGDVVAQVAGVFANAGRATEIMGLGLAAIAITGTEAFNTFDTRIAQFLTDYRIFSFNIDIETADWINGMIRTATGGFNDLIDIANTYLPEFLQKSRIEFDVIDTTAWQLSLDVLIDHSKHLESELVASNEAIADAWSNVHDLMMEPLPSENIQGWYDEIKRGIIEVAAVQAKADKEIKKAKKDADVDSEKLTAKELRRQNDVKQTQMSAVTDELAFFKNMMGEKSKGREALHRAEQVFSAVEQALSLQSALMNAKEAITSAFAAPFPVNFAAGAAMIAIMASLGLRSGGSGGGSIPSAEELQSTQGTGTLLGSDEKSRSIQNAQDRFEDLSIDQLAELRGIRDGIITLSSSIEKLARDFVGGGGVGSYSGETGLVSTTLGGLFGSKTKEVVDSGIIFVAQSLGTIIESGIVQAQRYFSILTKKKSFFGLFKSESVGIATEALDDAIREEMAGIFAHIGEIVLESAAALGFEETTVTLPSVLDVVGDGWDFSNIRGGQGWYGGDIFETVFNDVVMSLDDAIASFRVDIGQISFENMSGEEIQQELEAIFSQQADLIAEYLVPSIAEYQKIGEGLFDTLTRVTYEQVIFNDAIAAMGISLADLASTMQIEIAQSVLSIVGGAQELAELTEQFFNDFYTEAEQFEMLAGSLNDVLGGLGLSMFESRESFREMVEGADLTTDAGQRLFAQLLEIAPAMNDYFDVLDDSAAEEAAASERTLAEAQADAAVAAAALTTAQQTYTDQFLTNAEQFDLLSSDLEGSLSDLGLSMFESRDAFRDYIGDITQADAALLELLPLLDTYFDQLESDAIQEAAANARDLADAQKEQAIAAAALADAQQVYVDQFMTGAEQFDLLSANLGESLADLGLAMFESRESFQEYIGDITQADAALLELLPLLDAYFDKLESDVIRDAAATEAELAESRQAETAAAATLAAAQQVYTDQFLTNAEQFDLLSSDLEESLADLGLAMFDNRDAFREYIGDLTQADTVLLDLLPLIDAYFDKLENDAAIEAAEALESLVTAQEAAAAAAIALADAQQIYTDQFMTDTEQFDLLSSELEESLADLGLAMFDSRDAFREYIGDITQAPAALLELLPLFDQYFDKLESDELAAAIIAAEELAEATRLADETANALAQSLLDQAEASKALIKEHQRLEQIYIDQFMTGAEQFALLSADLEESLDGLGLSMFESRDAFREYIGDVTQAPAALLELLPLIDAYFDKLENDAAIEAADALESLVAAQEAAAVAANALADAQQTYIDQFMTDAEQFALLSAELEGSLDDLGLSMFDNRDAFREYIGDLTQADAALFDLLPLIDAYFDKLENDAIEEAAAREQALIDAREEEAAAANLLTQELEAANMAATQAAEELARAIESLTDSLIVSANSALDGLQAAVAVERDILSGGLEESLANIAIDYEARRRNASAIANAQIESQENQLAIVNERVSELAGLSGSIASALGGVFAQNRGNARDEIAAAIVAAQFGESLTGRSLESAIGVLTNIDAAGFKSQLELNIERAQTNRQLEQLGDLTAGQLSEAEKNAQLISSQIETIIRIADEQQETYDAWQSRDEEAARQQYDLEIEALDALVANAEAELNHLLGINEGVASLAEAQIAFNASIELLANQLINQSASIDELNEANMTAQANANAAAIPDQSSGEDVMKAVAVSSHKTAKILSRWDGDGMPAETTA